MTKKRNLTTFMIAIMIMLFSLPANAEGTVGYAQWDVDNRTLTFKGGESVPEGAYELNTGYNNPGWNVISIRESVTKVVFDESFKDVRPTSCYRWFRLFTLLTTIEGIENLNTEEVTVMSDMFNTCKGLENLDLSSFNTAKVEDMGYMFSGSYRLTSLDLSSFNTAKVTNMSCMFSGCYGLASLDLSSFNTAEVTDMSGMFGNCSALTSLDVSSFNTVKVTKMSAMFSDCSSLNKIYVSNYFATSEVISSDGMFYGCTNLIGNVPFDPNNIDHTMANYTSGYFTKSNLTPYVKWNADTKVLTFKVANYIEGTEGECEFNEGAIALEGVDLKNNCKKVVFTPSFKQVKPTSCYSWFDSFSNLTTIQGIENLNTEEVKNMMYMFYGCKKLTSLDLSSFNTAKVTNMNGMFGSCSSLTSLDVSSFNTDEVEEMSYMFGNCTGLKSLDLSSFNTAKVTNMAYMFKNCSGLTTIYVSDDFTISNVSSQSNLFDNCSKLKGAIAFNSDRKDKSMANYTTGYFSYGIKTVEDWNNFADKVNNGYTTMCAGLLKDITDANVLTTIGSNGFTGTFDGFGHTISGLNFNSTFSALYAQNGGTIKNLGILNATIAEGASGNICQTNSGTIESCYFMGTTTGSTQSAGGICPTNDGITKCYYLADEDNGNGGKTEEQFISGEVAYLLSQGTEGSVWGQQLGTDNNPVISEYKVIRSAKGANNTYWATFSNQNSDVTLSVPSARNLTVYNATVSNGKMTLSERTENQVAKGEGVLLKTDGEYVNAKANETEVLTVVDYANNNLVATPATEETIIADAEHKLYRLTYKNVSTKTGLGFYLGVVGDSKDGSQLKVTPGKAYLKVSTDAATDPSTSKLALGFAFPDNDDETVTGISGVTVSNRIQTSDRIYDLQGRPVVNPTKGVYIRNGRKVVY